MSLIIGLSEDEQRELLAAARGYVGMLEDAEVKGTMRSEAEKAERVSAFAMFKSLVEELEAGSSISAVNAKKACAYILEARADFPPEGASSKGTNYAEIAATIRHRAIAARATALSTGRK